MTRPRSRCFVCGKHIEIAAHCEPQPDGDACWNCMDVDEREEKAEESQASARRKRAA